MPDEDKKKKKEDVQKLRMILDNPGDTHALSANDKYLDSVRRRLGHESNSKHKMKTKSRSSSTHSEFLKTQVTIHGPYEKPVVPKDEPCKEPVVKPPTVVEKKPQQEELTDVNDLYDVEQIEDETTKIPEWKPAVATENQQTAIAVDTPAPEQVSAQPQEQNLPEWTPVAVVSAEPEPVSEKPTSTELQTGTSIPRIDQDGKRDVFKELRRVDSLTAERLYEKGFCSVESLRVASIESLIKAGLTKKVARSIKKEITWRDKNKAKQLKKAARVSVSVKTVQMKQPAAEWTVETQQKIEEVKSEPPKTLEKTKEETLPIWESVSAEEKQKPQMTEKKTRLPFFKKKSPEPVLHKETDEKQKPDPELKTKEKEEILLSETKKEKKPSKTKKKKSKPAEKKETVPTPKDKKTPILFKRRGKKEIATQETVLKESDEWVRKPKKETIKKPKVKKVLDSDWEQPDKPDESQTPEIKKDEPYQFGEYTLYKKEIKTADGKLRIIHFFSKTKLTNSSPSTLPEDCEVVVNEKTGLPFLKKR